MSKRMQNGGIVKMVEEGDIAFHLEAGWKLLGTEPQPRQDKIVAISSKVVSVEEQPSQEKVVIKSRKTISKRK